MSEPRDPGRRDPTKVHPPVPSSAFEQRSVEGRVFRAILKAGLLLGFLVLEAVVLLAVARALGVYG